MSVSAPSTILLRQRLRRTVPLRCTLRCEAGNDAADQIDVEDIDVEGDERVLQHVLQLGAAGRGRAEIAAALGLSPEALAAREAEDAALAATLSAASGLAQAWWEAMAREACEAGRFSFGAWTREMRRRFGESGPRSDSGSPKVGRRAAWAARPRARYVVPCNGRTRLNPDGTCPCGAYHDDEYWRAEDEAWRAESPENAEWPSMDEIEADDDDEDDDGRMDDDEQL